MWAQLLNRFTYDAESPLLNVLAACTIVCFINLIQVTLKIHVFIIYALVSLTCWGGVVALKIVSYFLQMDLS